MGLSLDDKLKFGKYKGETVGQVIIDDDGYLVWLRQERKSINGDENFFNKEVNMALDMCIGESKNLQKKFKKWGEIADDLLPVPASAPTPFVKSEKRGDDWGSF